MIEIKNLSKKYEVTALKNVNLTINSGEIVGVFGENGAGKTTLFKSILGFIKYDGQILLDGEPVNKNNIGKISFATSEHSFFAELTAKDHKEFYKEHFGTFNDKRYEVLMDFFNLPDNKPIKKMSFGQQNQFEVVLALSQGAQYIIMDEPFAGNDIFNREDFYRLLLGILKEDETVILATHLIEEVEEFVSRAVILRKGEIVDDVEMIDLQEKNIKLVDFIKKHYQYNTDKVLAAINKLD